ncbi:ABC transporter permease [Streptomyces sp. NPDC005423]|uniref:ABC transporter permease n=1 Tax=Streptomyces sp. NPDC005423 TaxID=3155343 RepID=UPI0033BFB18E
MTALAPPAPATGHPSATPHLVRWLLRLHRPALLAWTALVLVLGALLLWVGGPLTDASADAWRQYRACTTPTCAYDQTAILRYKDWYDYTTYAVLALPLLVAAWAGATLTSRELEHGTAHLAWTQSVSPVRWLTAKLALPAVPVAAGTALLVALHHWAWSTSQGRIDTAKRWYDTGTFAANGTIIVALSLAGLVTGVLVGLLRRQSLPALIGSAGITAALWSAADLLLPHLWPTVTRLSGIDGPKGAGITVSQGLVTTYGTRVTAPSCATDCPARYADLHAVGWYNDYHPASHYWPLQLLTSALVLVAAAGAAVAALRVLKHRTGATPARTATTA